MGTTGEAGRKDITMRDALSANNAKLLAHTSITEMTITLQTGDGEPVEIFNNCGGQNVNLLAENGAKLELISDLESEPEGPFPFGTDGKYQFCLTFAQLKKDTTVTVTYKTTLNREAYLADGGTIDKVESLKNTVKVGTSDGNAASSSSNSSVTVTRVMSKQGKLDRYKSEKGNDVLIWTIPLDLRTEYTQEQLANAETVAVTDRLNPSLAYVEGSLAVYQRVEQNSKVVRGSALPDTAYALERQGNALIVKLLEPAAYPVVEIEFKTEALASMSGLTNTVELNVDGKTHEEHSDPVDEIIAAGQTGYITSMTAPEWTPVAYKYLDGALCTQADAFRFTLTEVKADGSPLADAYTETVSNDNRGAIHFTTIKYAVPKNGETHYYKIVENDCSEGYQKDSTEYLVIVEMTRQPNTYQVAVTFRGPENVGEDIAFYNRTLIDISGEKTWVDQNDRAQARPEQITVRLFADGDEVDNKIVTPDADGNWNWTFSDLPQKTKDGTAEIVYTVMEDEVPGYTSVVTGDGEKGFKITNTYTSLTVQKTVSGFGVETDKAFEFTVTMSDKDGNAVSGVYGDMTFDENGICGFQLKHGESRTAVGLPVGAVYTVQETGSEGYTVTVNGVQTRDAAFEGIIAIGENVAAFNNGKPGGSFTPSPAGVTFTAQKALDGESPADGLFTFILRNADGAVIQTKQNVGGKVTFSALSFSKAGTYVYTISELAGSGDGIVYDTAVYTATVTVTESNGVYQTAVTYEKDGKAYDGVILFANTTGTPLRPDIPTGNESGAGDTPQDTPLRPDIPKGNEPATGDTTHMELWLILALLSAAGLLAVLFFGRKRNRESQ